MQAFFPLLSSAYLTMQLALGTAIFWRNWSWIPRNCSANPEKQQHWQVCAYRKPIFFVSDSAWMAKGFSWNSFIIVESIFFNKKVFHCRTFDQFVICVEHSDCATATLPNNSLTDSVCLSISLWTVALVIINGEFSYEF